MRRVGTGLLFMMLAATAVSEQTSLSHCDGACRPRRGHARDDPCDGQRPGGWGIDARDRSASGRGRPSRCGRKPSARRMHSAGGETLPAPGAGCVRASCSVRGGKLERRTPWAPEDRPTAAQIEAGLDKFEQRAWARLEPDRYAWSAVEHGERVGGMHVYVSSPAAARRRFGCAQRCCMQHLCTYVAARIMLRRAGIVAWGTRASLFSAT